MKNSTIVLILIMTFIMSNLLASHDLIEKNFPKVVNGKLETGVNALLEANLSKVLTQRWNSGVWEDSKRQEYSYNESGLPVHINYDSLDGGTWKTLMEMSMEYNASNLLLKSYTYIRDLNGDVEIGSMQEYSYDGNLVNEMMTYTWNENTSDWEAMMKDAFEYNDQLVVKSSTYMWDGSDWILSSETEFSYDGQGREIESLSKFWDSSENQFINNSKTTTEYYKDDKISRMETISWDFLTNQWSENPTEVIEYSYDSNDNQIEYIFTSIFGFGDFVFEIKSRSTMEYDGNNFLILQKEYNWDDITSAWSEIGKLEVTNNAEGLVIEDIYYSYDGANYNEQIRNLYEYGTATDVSLQNSMPDKLELYQNYPNPFNPSTTIKYSISERSNVTLKIFDILGNEISELFDGIQSPGEYKVIFNSSDSKIDLVSGVYIISLKSSNYSLTKKCLLLK